MYADENCKRISNLPLSVICIGLIFIFSGIFFLLKTLVIKPFVSESLIDISLIIILCYLSYNVIVKIIFGRKVVCQLTLTDSEINLSTMILQDKAVTLTDIKLVSSFTPDWFMKRFSLDKGNDPGLTIYLKDGRYFRISPHMERIDELKERLEKMIEGNFY